MKIVILISGNGSNLQAVIDAIAEGRLDNCEITLVLSDRKNAYGIERAKKAGLATLYLPFKKNEETRENYDERLALTIKKYQPSLIFCLGFLHIFSEAFVKRFEGMLINLHPALPGTFTGLDCIEKQYVAMKEGKTKECGVMCHYVDSGVDTGSVIATRKIDYDANISLEAFEKKIHTSEHEMVVSVLSELCKKKR